MTTAGAVRRFAFLLLFVILASVEGRLAGAADDDDKIKILLPKGTRERKEAKDHVVPRKVKITWDKPDKLVAVQAYQKEKLIKEWKLVKSGDELLLPNAGETEIKIWSGKETQDDAIWVWIKEK